MLARPRPHQRYNFAANLRGLCGSGPDFSIPQLRSLEESGVCRFQIEISVCATNCWRADASVLGGLGRKDISRRSHLSSLVGQGTDSTLASTKVGTFSIPLRPVPARPVEFPGFAVMGASSSPRQPDKSHWSMTVL